MSESVGGQTSDPVGPTSSAAAARAPRSYWSVHPWRLIPPLIVLVTVLVVWATRFDQLITNHWAYPLALIVAGIVSGYLVIGARPRRIHRPLPYPEHAGPQTG